MNRKLEKLHPEQWKNILQDWDKEITLLLRTMKIEENKNPEINGHIRISKCNGSNQYYYIDEGNPKNKNGKYISKKNIEFIKEVAQKNFNLQFIHELENEKKLVTSFLEKYDKIKASNLFENLNLERQKIVEPPTLSNEEYAKKWQNENYRKKGFSANDPEFLTSKKERVRSKSELIIANMLEKNNIPYKYEYPVKLGNYYVHPDFYCLNVRTRKEYAWEHLGILDNPSYATKNVKKITDYQRNGFFLGQDLLISMETKFQPLTAHDAERMIFRYLK